MPAQFECTFSDQSKLDLLTFSIISEQVEITNFFVCWGKLRFIEMQKPGYIDRVRLTPYLNFKVK